MAGFPFAAIGAGLGQGAQQYQQQQEAQQRMRMMLEMFQQQQQDRQREQQSASAAWPAMLSADNGLAGLATLPGGAPGGTSPGMGSSPAGGSYEPTSSGSGFQSGLRRLIDLGVAPEVAQGAVGYMQKNESGNNPLAVNPTSGALGRAQWLGPRKAALTSQYGQQPSDDQQADFMAGELQGPERRVLDGLLKAKTGKEGYDIWGRDFERPGQAALTKAGVGSGGLPPQLHQEVQQTAQRAGQGVDPFVYGRMSLSALAKQIEQANPGADPVVKMMALERASKLLAPGERQQWQMLQMQNRQEMQIAMEQMREQFRAGQAIDKSAEQGWQIVTQPDGSMVRVKAGTGEVAPIELPSGSTKLGTGSGAGGGGKASKNVVVTDGEGKSIFKGAAHQTPQGWVADKDGKPIAVPEDGNITISGAGGGRQATTQINSMIGSTSELVGEARNLMELPATSVAGIFQGLQGVPANHLGEAMKRTLANKITPEESTDLITSFQGVGRALATIEAQGRATGLVTLTGMSQQLMPQTGDTMGNVLRKLATLRQIMERNTDAMEAAGDVTPQQRALLAKLRGEMAEVIPFTVSEVNKLQHGDQETMLSAAAKFGLKGAGGGGAVPGAPKPGDMQDGYIFQGGNPADPKSWMQAPPGAVQTR